MNRHLKFIALAGVFAGAIAGVARAQTGEVEIR